MSFEVAIWPPRSIISIEFPLADTAPLLSLLPLLGPQESNSLHLPHPAGETNINLSKGRLGSNFLIHKGRN